MRAVGRGVLVYLGDDLADASAELANLPVTCSGIAGIIMDSALSQHQPRDNRMMKSAEEERQIVALINRYSLAVDSGDWILLRSCWANDVFVDFEIGKTWDSADELNIFMADFHTGLKTLHMNGNYMLEDIGPSRVRGRTYVKAVLFRGDGSLLMRNDGWYDDEFAKIDGEWKITRRHSHQVHMEHGPAGE